MGDDARELRAEIERLEAGNKRLRRLAENPEQALADATAPTPKRRRPALLQSVESLEDGYVVINGKRVKVLYARALSALTIIRVAGLRFSV